MSEAQTELINALSGVEVREGEKLDAYTGYRTGGPAKAVLAPNSREAFIKCARALIAAKESFFVLGNGSNVLVPDGGYDGCVLLTERALSDISIDGNNVSCGAGVSLIRLCRECAERGLTGLEFAYGIPGTVGGAVFMNAGAYGGEMQQVVSSVEMLSKEGDIVTIEGEYMGFGYRTSRVQRLSLIVLGASFELASAPKEDIIAKMEELMARRRDKQPLEYPSCGSTFKRPEGAFAGKLIEDCSLRGFKLGGAQISEKHCGFVINAGGATSADILELIETVQKTVKEKTGYFLECEIRVMK